jgi:hypothetical protein
MRIVKWPTYSPLLLEDPLVMDPFQSGATPRFPSFEGWSPCYETCRRTGAPWETFEKRRTLLYPVLRSPDRRVVFGIQFPT